MAEDRTTRLPRRGTLENFLDYATNGGLGATQELGYGERDPMCVAQHYNRRILGRKLPQVNDDVQVITEANSFRDLPTQEPAFREIEGVELLPRELNALSIVHNAEVRYRSEIGQLNSDRSAKLREFPEILERILAGEKVKLGGVEIDVNADYAMLVEEELERARKEDSRMFEYQQLYDMAMAHFPRGPSNFEESSYRRMLSQHSRYYREWMANRDMRILMSLMQEREQRNRSSVWSRVHSLISGLGV